MEASELLYNMAMAEMTKVAIGPGPLNSGAGGGSNTKDSLIQALTQKLDAIKAKKIQKKQNKAYANSPIGKFKAGLGTAMSAAGEGIGQQVGQSIATHGLSAAKSGFGAVGGGMLGSAAGAAIGGLPGMAIGGLLGAKKGYNAMRTPSMGEQIMSTLQNVAPHILNFMEAKKRMDMGHPATPRF